MIREETYIEISYKIYIEISYKIEQEKRNLLKLEFRKDISAKAGEFETI